MPDLRSQPATVQTIRAYLKQEYAMSPAANAPLSEEQLDLIMSHPTTLDEIARAQKLASFTYYPGDRIASFHGLDVAPWAEDEE